MRRFVIYLPYQSVICLLYKDHFVRLGHELNPTLIGNICHSFLYCIRTILSINKQSFNNQENYTYKLHRQITNQFNYKKVNINYIMN